VGAIADLHAQAMAKGRDPQSIELSLLWAPPDADRLKRYRDIGHRARRPGAAVDGTGPGAEAEMLDGMAGLVPQVG